MGQTCCKRRKRRRKRIRHSQLISTSKEDDDEAGKAANGPDATEVKQVEVAQPVASPEIGEKRNEDTIRSNSTAVLGPGITRSRIEQACVIKSIVRTPHGHESLAKLVYKMIEHNQSLRKKSHASRTESSGKPRGVRMKSCASKQKVSSSRAATMGGIEKPATPTHAVLVKSKTKFSKTDPALDTALDNNRRFSSMF